MGHTMDVHKAYYRATSGMIERMEIAKLMLIQERNKVGRFAGRDLSKVTFDGMFLFCFFVFVFVYKKFLSQYAYVDSCLRFAPVNR